MGYFSNGTEGDMYQQRYCNRCKNDVNEDCPIWLAHLIHNGHEILDLFIPRAGVENRPCTMFVEREPES